MKFHLTLPSIVVVAAAMSRQNRIDVRSCHTNHAQIGTAAASKPPTFKCFRCLAWRCQPSSTQHSRLSLHYSISVVIFVGKCLLIKNSLDSSKRDILKSSEMSHSMWRGRLRWVPAVWFRWWDAIASDLVWLAENVARSFNIHLKVYGTSRLRTSHFVTIPTFDYGDEQVELSQRS